MCIAFTRRSGRLCGSSWPTKSRIGSLKLVSRCVSVGCVGRGAHEPERIDDRRDHPHVFVPDRVELGRVEVRVRDRERTRCRIDSSSSRPSTSSSANVSSMPSKYFAGVMLWYTSTIGSGRDSRNDDDRRLADRRVVHEQAARTVARRTRCSGSTSSAEPGAMCRANTSDGPMRRNTSRYSSATFVIASPGDAAARI